MTIAPAFRAHSGDYDAIFEKAINVIDRVAITDLLPESELAPAGIGRPAKLGRYNLRGILVCLFEIVWSGSQVSWANVLRRLWFVYSDDQMDAIGLGGLRTAATLARMAPAGGRFAHMTADEIRVAESAMDAEYKRLWTYLNIVLKPLDTNALPADRRHTRGELDAARNNEDLAAPTALLKVIMNRIVAASIEAHNADNFPNSKNALDGILKDWTGDVAIDEHIHAADLGEGTGSASHKMNSANQQARAYAHIRRPKFGSGVGTTFAVATSRPGRREVPAVATAMAIHDPSPGSIPGLLDALTGAELSGMRPPLTGSRNQFTVVDMGYTGKPTLAENLLAKKYGLVMKYPSTWHTLFNLNSENKKRSAKSKDQANTGATSGPYLFNGTCLCPGAARRILNGPRFDVPVRKNRTKTVENSKAEFEAVEDLGPNAQVNTTTGEIEGDESPDNYLQRLVDHHVTEDTITNTIMPTHGRPTQTTARRRGRPRLDEPTPSKVFKITVQCPARAGLVQCPLFTPDNETPDERAHRRGLPMIPDPPVSLNDAPPVCHTSYSTVEMNEQQFNQWQPMVAGTWEHEDLYTTARSRNEWFHSQLVSPTGGNFTSGAIQFRKNSSFNIAVALAVAVTNLKILQSWQEDLKRYGNAPVHGGSMRKAIRDDTIEHEITKYLRPDSK